MNHPDTRKQKLRKIALRYADLARAISDINAVAAVHPDVKELLAQLPVAVARPFSMEEKGREEMRNVCVAYRDLLGAAANSPLARIAQSAALMAELNRPAR